VRFVFPHAPARPVTSNGGMVMPAWYDITALARPGGEDANQVRASAAQIDALLAREVSRGVPSDRVVIAGFSQGAALALHVGTRYPERLAGIMVLSGYEVRAAWQARATPEREALWQEFPMAHEVSEDEIVVVRDWLHARLR
jgi:phospholipase/carboxylesterase